VSRLKSVVKYRATNVKRVSVVDLKKDLLKVVSMYAQYQVCERGNILAS
jgi:septum formation topological specificity factor MinE